MKCFFGVEKVVGEQVMYSIVVVIVLYYVYGSVIKRNEIVFDFDLFKMCIGISYCNISCQYSFNVDGKVVVFDGKYYWFGVFVVYCLSGVYLVFRKKRIVFYYSGVYIIEIQVGGEVFFVSVYKVILECRIIFKYGISFG